MSLHHLDAHRGFVPDRAPTLGNALDRSDAEEAILRDPDTFSDWLSAKCMGVAQVREQRVLREVTAEDFTAWPVGRLIALLFDVGQPDMTIRAARDAIAARYLADPRIKRLTDEKAREIENRRLQDERNDSIDEVADRVGCRFTAAWLVDGDRA